jgi:PAS domain S-box-containing protein
MATAVRTRETALQESEARFRALFETANDAIVVTDLRGPGRVLAANPAAGRLFGYTADEFAGLDRATCSTSPIRPWRRSGRADDDRPRHRAHVSQGREPFTGELTAAMLPDARAIRRLEYSHITARKQADTALRDERFVSRSQRRLPT